MKGLKIKTTRQGLPVVRNRDMTILEVTDKYIIGTIDLRHKWCIIESTFSTVGGRKKPTVGFYLAPSMRTCEIEGWKVDSESNDTTEVTFLWPKEKFDIFMISCNSYTINFVLERL